jgi:hypothetical protein
MRSMIDIKIQSIKWYPNIDFRYLCEYPVKVIHTYVGERFEAYARDSYNLTLPLVRVSHPRLNCVLPPIYRESMTLKGH